MAKAKSEKFVDCVPVNDGEFFLLVAHQTHNSTPVYAFPTFDEAEDAALSFRCDWRDYTCCSISRFVDGRNVGRVGGRVYRQDDDGE